MGHRAKVPAALESAWLSSNEEVRWAALALGRTARFAGASLLHLFARARDRAWRALYLAGWEASVWGRWGWTHLCAEGREISNGFAALWRDIAQIRLNWRLASELIPAAMLCGLLLLLAPFMAPRADADHKSVRQLAIEARAHQPPPCFLVDGRVWVLDNGRYLRPGRPDYEERRSELCGF